MNSKNKLQEYCQKKKIELPKYSFIIKDDNFISSVIFNNKTYTGNPCKKKIDAELHVASIALEDINAVSNIDKKENKIDKKEDKKDNINMWINHLYPKLIENASLKDSSETKKMIFLCFLHKNNVEYYEDFDLSKEDIKLYDDYVNMGDTIIKYHQLFKSKEDKCYLKLKKYVLCSDISDDELNDVMKKYICITHVLGGDVVGLMKLLGLIIDNKKF